ncbi:hypothetical protein NO1_0586 [Candidatus Termititenax aidoneus]|uniref:Uncharacterized protein n=1 Tax=Termititenax aidoneus TaxID=2218524 RepID=A0A388T9U4_TERA1|nr:hypothetical protein NO1_0586 [Candidatus Termititenax aidoneus]
MEIKINNGIKTTNIPILVPKENLDAIGDGYEFVETLDYPQDGNGDKFKKGFFEAVLNSLKNKPIPGDKEGHKEASNHDDFFIIGGKLEDNGDDTGQLHLRVRVPEKDYLGNSNDGFVRSLKTGNQYFSLVFAALPEQLERHEVDTIVNEELLRNDAVNANPAMRDQQVSLKNGLPDETQIIELIRKGNFEKNGLGGTLITDGFVSRPFCIRKQFKGTASERKLYAKFVKAMSDFEKNKKKELDMDEEQLRKILADFVREIKGNAETDETRKAAESAEAKIKQLAVALTEIKKALGLPETATDQEVLDAVQSAIDAAKEGDGAVAETEAAKLAGRTTVKNAEGKDEPDPAFEFAKKELVAMGHDVRKKELREKKLEDLRNNVVLKKLRSIEADSYKKSESKQDDGFDKF